MIRSDLTPAQQLVQGIHAAHEAGRLAGLDDNISSVVVLTVPNEKALMRAFGRVTARGMPAVLFREPDIGDQATAFATLPLDQTSRSYFSGYRLWTEEALYGNSNGHAWQAGDRPEGPGCDTSVQAQRQVACARSAQAEALPANAEAASNA